MNWLDIVIAVVLIFPIFTGLKQGLIKAALSLAGLIVGVILASNFYQQLGGALGFITNEDIADVVASPFGQFATVHARYVGTIDDQLPIGRRVDACK